MSFLLFHDYLKNFHDCWNCGREIFKGRKCPHCGALPERPRLYAEQPPETWAKDRPDK